MFTRFLVMPLWENNVFEDAVAFSTLEVNNRTVCFTL